MEFQNRFYQQFAVHPTLSVRAPGRVNLLGEHVDYNGGIVLPAAVDRAVYLAAAPTSDDIIRLVALDLDQRVAFHLNNLPARVDLEGQPLPAWALYPAGVAWALQEAGFRLSGMQAAYTSNVPMGAGLSSSAAVEVGFAVLWEQLGNLPLDCMQVARLCQRAENGYVGVSCGLMDQFASAHGVAGHALWFDTRSLEWAPVPLPVGTAIVIADSSVRRSLAGSAYNDRRAACEQAVKLLQQYLPAIRSLRDVSPTEFAAYKEYLPPVVRMRAEHVVQEIGRVQSAVSALQRQDRQAFGALMFSCHASLRDLYEVSIPELDTLVKIAHDLPGCLGARLTGAGFGGCTVNLVETDQADTFIQKLQEAYHQATGLTAQVYCCQASQGASRID